MRQNVKIIHLPALFNDQGTVNTLQDPDTYSVSQWQRMHAPATSSTLSVAAAARRAKKRGPGPSAFIENPSAYVYAHEHSLFKRSLHNIAHKHPLSAEQYEVARLTTQPRQVPRQQQVPLVGRFHPGNSFNTGAVHGAPFSRKKGTGYLPYAPATSE